MPRGVACRHSSSPAAFLRRALCPHRAVGFRLRRPAHRSRLDAVEVAAANHVHARELLGLESPVLYQLQDALPGYAERARRVVRADVVLSAHAPDYKPES